MNILIAPDKFKGTLTAQQVCDCIEQGLKKRNNQVNITKFPLADGGDGTLSLLLRHLNGKSIEADVFNPLFSKIKSSYGLSNDGKTAFIEMASASGMRLIKERGRAIMFSSTYGTGELIRDALDKKVKKIIIGIGGSATNDAALGAAHALGFRFYSSKDELLDPVGKNLSQIVRIDDTAVHPRLKEVSITAICDVTNPFYGETGAAYAYGPQKGATEQEIVLLDAGLRNIASVFQHRYNVDVQQIAGAGAGGGFAGGALVMFKAILKPGIETIFEVTQFEDEVKRADCIVTGEGKIDAQTLDGKLLMGVLRLAKKHNKKVIAIAGQSELAESQLFQLGFDQVHTLSAFTQSPNRAIENAENALKELSENLWLTS